LGAGLALLLGVVTKNKHPNLPLTVVAYAPALVVGVQLAKKIEKYNNEKNDFNIVNFVNKCDLVSLERERRGIVIFFYLTFLLNTHHTSPLSLFFAISHCFFF
jgi:hypothetical protein